ncbi:MAG: tyrosine-type recombinase/integrase [Planctomycetota bacterium]
MHRGSWTSNPEQARKEAEGAKGRARRVRDVEPMTLGEAIDSYFAVMERRKVTDATWQDATRKVRNLRRFFHDDTILETITRRDLDQFRDFRLQNKIGARIPNPRTVERDIDYLGFLIRRARRDERYSGADPTRDRERPVEKRTEPGFYTPNQIRELIECYRSVNYPTSGLMPHLVVALFTTGFRAAELCRLTRSNCDFKARTWTVERKKSIQSLPMCVTAGLALQEVAGESDELIFTRSKRATAAGRAQALSILFDRWREVLPAHLVEHHHPHTFRHSFQTQLLESGAPVHHVVALMDHSKKGSMTLNYAHATPGALRETLEAAFDGLGLM